MAPFRFGLIGAGRMGRTHLRAFAGSELVAVTAIAEVSGRDPPRRGRVPSMRRSSPRPRRRRECRSRFVLAPLVSALRAAPGPDSSRRPWPAPPGGLLSVGPGTPLGGLPRAQRRNLQGHGVHEFDQLRWLTGQELGALRAVVSGAVPDGLGQPPDVDGAQVLAELSGGGTGFISLGRYHPAGDMARRGVRHPRHAAMRLSRPRRRRARAARGAAAAGRELRGVRARRAVRGGHRRRRDSHARRGGAGRRRRRRSVRGRAEPGMMSARSWSA